MGAGLSKVQVSARLNFEQVDRTIESYNPDGAVLSNEQRSETSGDSVAGGGTSTIVNNSYQNSRTIEKIVGSVGGITRLTVAVIVDEKALGKASGSNRSVIDAQVSRLDGLVRNAIGLDSARGDRLTVTAIPFETEALAAILKDSTAKPATPVLVYVDRFSRPVLGIVGIVAAMILALRVLRSPGSTPGGALARGGIRSSAVNVSEPEPELPPVVVDALTAVTTKMKNQVQAESASHPETAAQVIRAWLMETG
jgi:flagellar M-ring protein FliF